MVKPTQTICRQIADELFECVRPFYEIGAKRVKKIVNGFQMLATFTKSFIENFDRVLNSLLLCMGASSIH